MDAKRKVLNRIPPGLLTHAVGVMWWGALFCVAFGGAVELIQGAMAMGRGCDLWDFVADTVGVALSVALTPPVLKWLLK